MNELLKNNLLIRSKADQEMRNRAAANGFDNWDSTIDENNTAYLQKTVTKSGWPRISDVGPEAARAAWLLVQHADHNPVFQAHCLELMKTLPKSEVVDQDVAYLEDRVRVGRGEPQLYGTQFMQVGDTFEPQPIEDLENLERRRAAMGLEPFADNMQRIIDTYVQPK